MLREEYLKMGGNDVNILKQIKSLELDAMNIKRKESKNTKVRNHTDSKKSSRKHEPIRDAESCHDNELETEKMYEQYILR